MPALSNPCQRFQANMFSNVRCQHCYKGRETHTEGALHSGKMARRVTARGFLYVAPDNVDFASPNHKSRRWQRRWFTLYDDGELSYALDQNPETIPQVVIDLNDCNRVTDAQLLTGNRNSIALTVVSSQHGDKYCAVSNNEVYYIKADTNEEIKRWQSLLGMYAKQNSYHEQKNVLFIDEKNHFNDQGINVSDHHNHHLMERTIIEVKESRRRSSSRCSSDRSSSCSANNERHRFKGDPVLGDLDGMDCPTGKSNGQSTHRNGGTPRSVKYRARLARDECVQLSSQTPMRSVSPPPTQLLMMINNNNNNSNNNNGRQEDIVLTTNALSEYNANVNINNNNDSNYCNNGQVWLCNGKSEEEMTIERCQLIDDGYAKKGDTGDIGRLNGTTNEEGESKSLRKGWLMLRGRTDSDWQKYWAVLTAPRLTLYRDVTAEECEIPKLEIDLSKCENVYPTAAVRHYGIEIRCQKRKQNSYILSALTAGIRDSWISAILQNIKNAKNSVASAKDDPEILLGKKMHISRRVAYVVAESHRENEQNARNLHDDDYDQNFAFNSQQNGNMLNWTNNQDGSSTDLSTDSVEADYENSDENKEKEDSDEQEEEDTIEMSESENDDTSDVSNVKNINNNNNNNININNININRRMNGISEQIVSPTSIRRSPISRLKEKSAESRRHRPSSIGVNDPNRQANLDAAASDQNTLKLNVNTKNWRKKTKKKKCRR